MLAKNVINMIIASIDS